MCLQIMFHIRGYDYHSIKVATFENVRNMMTVGVRATTYSANRIKLVSTVLVSLEDMWSYCIKSFILVVQTFLSPLRPAFPLFRVLCIHVPIEVTLANILFRTQWAFSPIS
jgi:hypothetical protein